MSASRQLGIQQAQGEYVAFIDADDVWMPEKLSRQVAGLNQSADVAMTYGPGLYWYSWTGHAEDLGRDFVQPLAIGRSQVVTPPNLVPGWLRRPFDQPCPSGALVRTERLRETGPQNDFRGLYEDQVLFCRIGLRHSILVSDDCLYKYRQHEQSCCSQAQRTGIRIAARLMFLRWLDGYLDEERITNRDVRRAVARERRALRPPTALAATCKKVARSLLSPPVRLWIRSRLTRFSPGRPGV
jgi:glycosyltransferase involved in cell wall biosynthesis